jgi:transposase
MRQPARGRGGRRAKLLPAQYGAFRRDAARLSDASTAARWGMSATTASRWRRRLCPGRRRLSTHPEFPADAVAEGVRRLWGTKPTGEIAAALGCSTTTVRRVVRRLGLPMGASRSPKAPLSVEEERRFAELARQATGWGTGRRGPTLRTLAGEFGLSVKSAGRLRARLGLQAQRPPRRRREVTRRAKRSLTWRCSTCLALVSNARECPQGHTAAWAA